MRLGGHEGTRGARLGTVLVVATHRHTAEGPAAARPRAQAPGPRKTWSAVDVPDEPRRRRWRWRQRPRQQSPATTRVRGGFFAPSPVLPKQGLFQDKKRRVNAAVQYQRAGGFARRSPPAGRLGPHRQPSAVGRALVAAAHRSIGGGATTLSARSGAVHPPTHTLSPGSSQAVLHAAVGRQHAGRVDPRLSTGKISRMGISVSQAPGLRGDRANPATRSSAHRLAAEGVGFVRTAVWRGTIISGGPATAGATRVDSGQSCDNPNPPRRCRNVTSATARHLLIPTSDRHGLSTVARGAVQTPLCVQQAEDGEAA